MKRWKQCLAVGGCVLTLTLAGGCAELGTFVGNVLRAAAQNKQSANQTPRTPSNPQQPVLTLVEQRVTGMHMRTSGKCNMKLKEPFTWDWGDGSITRDDFPAGHTYQRPGRYTVRVTATTMDGRQVTASTSVTIGQESGESIGEYGRGGSRR